MVRNGARLQSQVCETQVIVVRSGASLDDLWCGGQPMVGMDAQKSGDGADPGMSGGSVMGKRYVDGAGAEVLVTKAGAGTLSIAGTPLAVKEANSLPASD